MRLSFALVSLRLVAVALATNLQCTTETCIAAKCPSSVPSTTTTSTVTTATTVSRNSTTTTIVTPPPTSSLVNTTQTFTSTVTTTPVTTSTFQTTVTATTTETDTATTTSFAMTTTVTSGSTVTVPPSPGFTPLASALIAIGATPTTENAARKRSVQTGTGSPPSQGGGPYSNCTSSSPGQPSPGAPGRQGDGNQGKGPGSNPAPWNASPGSPAPGSNGGSFQQAPAPPANGQGYTWGNANPPVNGGPGPNSGPHGPPGGAYGQPGSPNGQPGSPNGQPGSPNGQPGGSYGQPGGSNGQPGGPNGGGNGDGHKPWKPPHKGPWSTMPHQNASSTACPTKVACTDYTTITTTVNATGSILTSTITANRTTITSTTTGSTTATVTSTAPTSTVTTSQTVTVTTQTTTTSTTTETGTVSTATVQPSYYQACAPNNRVQRVNGNSAGGLRDRNYIRLGSQPTPYDCCRVCLLTEGCVANYALNTGGGFICTGYNSTVCDPSVANPTFYSERVSGGGVTVSNSNCGQWHFGGEE